jgi:hypothetical protein
MAIPVAIVWVTAILSLIGLRQNRDDVKEDLEPNVR